MAIENSNILCYAEKFTKGNKSVYVFRDDTKFIRDGSFPSDHVNLTCYNKSARFKVLQWKYNSSELGQVIQCILPSEDYVYISYGIIHKEKLDTFLILTRKAIKVTQSERIMITRNIHTILSRA